MGNKDPIWFRIEEAFSDIEQACLRARAAQLVAQQKETDRKIARSIAGGGGAPPSTAEPKGTDRYARAVEIAKDAAFREENLDGPDLVDMRKRIRGTLQQLRNRLREVLPQNEELDVLFPLVVHTDELASAATRGAVERWEPMQGEYFNIQDGGERFYTRLEERFVDERTHPLVFEMYYFCLVDGFAGRYDAGSRKLDEYKSRLQERIVRYHHPIKFPDVRRDLTAGRAKGDLLVSFPWWYYAIAAGVVLLVYVVLSLLAGA